MTKPARVLMVSNDPSVFTEGSEVRARLRAYATHLEVLHVLSRGGKGIVNDGNLTIHGAGIGIFARFTLAKQARKIIESEKIEVVSAQDPFEHGLAALRAVRGTTAKLHIQIHTDFLSPSFAKESFVNRTRVRIADKVLPQAKGIRVVSERIAHGLSLRYENKIVPPSVLPIMVPLYDGPAVPLPEGLPAFRLIAVSRLVTEKRVEDLLKAVALVRKRENSVALVLVGEGKKRSSLESLAKSLGIKDVVYFVGARADARGLMKSATAFIQTSSYEGYGRTLVEAALAHIPIITTDVGIVGEVLHADESALVAPVGDIARLALHIGRLVEDNRFRFTLTERAEDVVKQHQASFGDLPERIAEDISVTIQK